MQPTVRKLITWTETQYREGGRPADPPLRLLAVAAVIANPWAGNEFVEDLRPEILEQAPILGELITDEITRLAGSGEAVEAYGKAAVVGTAGEIEHGSAIIHTLRFGNIYRQAVGAESFLSFSNTRGPANAPITIPLMHKHDAGKRSHYLTIQFSISDAPTPDEIVIALGASIGGRPHHRIGDRYQDMAELDSNNE